MYYTYYTSYTSYTSLCLIAGLETDCKLSYILVGGWYYGFTLLINNANECNENDVAV